MGVEESMHGSSRQKRKLLRRERQRERNIAELGVGGGKG